MPLLSKSWCPCPPIAPYLSLNPWPTSLPHHLTTTWSTANISQPIVNRGADEFEPCWLRILTALEDIHGKNAGRLSFEELYRASYKIVLTKRGAELYDRVSAFEKEWFDRTVIPQIRSLVSRNLVSLVLIQLPGSSPYERRQLGEKFLRGVRDSWEDHNLSMNMIADILMYLDRGYTQDNSKPSIWTTTIGLFRDNILRSGLGDLQDELLVPFIIFDILNAVILDLINMEREGDVIDRNLLRKCTSMLEVLCETDEEVEDKKLYLTVFEPLYLSTSKAFYQKECTRLLRDADASSWLRHTQQRLAEEQARCETTISMLTADKITKVVEDELISTPMAEFLAMEGSGLKAMIDNDRVQDLTILYQLASRVEKSKAALKAALRSRVMALGMEIEQALRNTDFSATAAGNTEGEDAVNEGAEKSKQQPLSAAALQTAAAIKWVDDVIRLKDKFDDLSHTCFNEDIILSSAVTNSFQSFISAYRRSSEYLSLFIDENLKRGVKDKTEAEVDAVLEKAIILLRYLADKDMFERYYQKHLGRRLLFQKSGSIDVEQQMISRMKQEVGNHFTVKFEGMFKDMDISRGLSEDYKRYISNLGEAGTDRKPIDLVINVLMTNNWPPEIVGRSSQPDEKGGRVDCIYPPEIKRLQESFANFYSADRNGRVLTWVDSAGTADIKCIFPKIPGKESGPLSKERRYELNVSTHGMIVLMLFNDLADNASLTFEDIQERTKIPSGDLTKVMATLTLVPKCRVLLKDPPTKHIKLEDKFRFNAEFVSKTIKIKAPTISGVSKVEGVQERSETEKRNEQTRQHLIDAAIVRIMKYVLLLSPIM